MIKGTPELIARRREEIINACEKLYETMSFGSITLKDIGKATSFTRTSIYNYFESKEEIFLAMLEREYDGWADDLKGIASEIAEPDGEKISNAIAESLSNRQLLLKLLSVNFGDLEENSRLELLTSFSVAYGRARDELTGLIKKACPDRTDAEIEETVFSFLPFLHGVYPYAAVTEKQLEAMDKAKVARPAFTVRGLVCDALMRMLPQ